MDNTLAMDSIDSIVKMMATRNLLSMQVLTPQYIVFMIAALVGQDYPKPDG
jgi:hypothetical protein